MKLTLLKLVIYWWVVNGATIFILKQLGADQLHGFPINALYFLFFTGVSLILFADRSSPLEHKDIARVGLKLTAVAGLYLTLCLTINRLWPLNSEATSKIMDLGLYFPLYVWKTDVTKICDVFFQQVTVFLYLQKLLKIKTNQIVWLFSGLFFFLHAPLFIVRPGVALYLAAPSAIAGWLFASLILKFRDGVVYSFAAHLGFYFLAGLYLRSF